MRKTLTIGMLLILGAGGAWAAASKKAPAPASPDALYPCTEDCTTREGGYRWAEHYAIADAANCKGKSVAFVDGCKDYIADLNRPPRARNDDRYNDDRYNDDRSNGDRYNDDRYDDDNDEDDNYDDDDDNNYNDDDDDEYEDDDDGRGSLSA